MNKMRKVCLLQSEKTIMKKHYMPGFTLSWSGPRLMRIISISSPSVLSGTGVLENIFETPLEQPESLPFFLTFSNPVYPDGWLLAPAHFCSVKTH